MPCEVPGCAKWSDGLIRIICFLSGCKQTINYLSNDYMQMKESNGFHGQQYAPKVHLTRPNLNENSQKEQP